MATSIDEFLNAASSNTIRANNQWEAVFTSGYNDIDNVLKKAVMFGKNFELPNRSIEYASIHYKGFEMANIVPTKMTMGNEHTITIQADVDGEYRRAFLAWQGKVMNPDISGGSVFEGDRSINEKSIVRINLLDKFNKTPVETYKFYNVRVTNVGPMTLTYEGGDVATFDVTFKSTYWEIETAKNGALLTQK